MLFDKDASFYAKEVKQGKVTVKELIQRCLDNVRELNPKLNAIVHIQEEEALKKAQDYDVKLSSMAETEKEGLPYFFGVPILVKDLGQTQAGHPSTSGSKLLKNNKVEVTSNFVRQVQKAGFIIVGRTNVPEFGFKSASDSELHGPVNNPFDPALNAGGSSGGAAAALKAGIAPVVTASDGGGSIRMPASFNGLIGLKPTRGRTPVGPSRYRGWQGAAIDFSLTRSVDDTWEMLKAVQVEQTDAPFTYPIIKEKELKILDKKLKIAYSLESPVGTEVTQEAKNAVQTTIVELEKKGHTLIEQTPDIDGIKAMQTYYVVNGVETYSMIKGIEEGLNRQVDKSDIETMSWAIYRSGANISAAEYSQLLAHWDQMAAAMERFFEEYDALLTPATNGPAFHHEEFDRSEELLNRLNEIDHYEKEEQQDLIWEMFQYSLAWTPFTQQQNLTGQPAISLPLYETEEGLPVGSQIWTGKGREYLLLQIAKQLEENEKLKTNIVKVK